MEIDEGSVVTKYYTRDITSINRKILHKNSKEAMPPSDGEKRKLRQAGSYAKQPSIASYIIHQTSYTAVDRLIGS